ncbi:hypothetical protein Tco_1231521, partial [Tanacetum coccineum]
MYTRGRKKDDAEPAPPARDPRDVEMIERLQQQIQELELQQPRPDSLAEDAKTEPNIWDEESVDVNPFGDDRYRDDPIRNLGLKIEIPEFTGKVHPDDFIDWLSTVEHVFDVQDIPDKLKVKLMAIKLRQHASLWWDHITKRFDETKETSNETKRSKSSLKISTRCGNTIYTDHIDLRLSGNV